MTELSKIDEAALRVYADKNNITYQEALNNAVKYWVGTPLCNNPVCCYNKYGNCINPDQEHVVLICPECYEKELNDAQSERKKDPQ